MFYNKLVCYLTLFFMVTVTFTQANGLKKRFFLQFNDDSCLSQECLECQCSHLERHKGRDRRDGHSWGGTEECHDYCYEHTCKHTRYGDICPTWNHGLSFWNNWESWSSCTKSCGGGIMSRKRTCPLNFYTSSCVGANSETKSCNNATCLVDGGWSPWQSVSSCSVTCGAGYMFQVRFCDSPTPSNGGQLCQGDKMEKIPCSLSSCPAKSVWVNMTTCSVTCGQGHMVQTKNCTDGQNCQLGQVDSRLVNCSEAPCPVDGGWSPWKDVSICSHTCGNGTKLQTRHCDSPKPDHGGQDCAGDRLKFISCNSQPCPVDGGWSLWKDISTCSHTCGGGILQQMRTCDNPYPAHGGHKCTGNDYQSIFCNTHSCSVKPTVNQNISSNLTNGGTPLGVSQPVPSTTPHSMSSKMTGGLASTTGNIHMVGVTQIVIGHTASAPMTSIPSVTQKTSTWATPTTNGQSTSMKPTVNQSISSNLTNGGTSPSTSQPVPSTTKQNTVSKATGGVGSTVGNIHMVGVTQIVTGHTASVSRTSNGPSTSTVKPTVNISSNFTNGGTSPTTTQNTTSKATGGVASTAGNIHMVGVTQIVTGNTASVSRTSISPVAQKTSTLAKTTNGHNTPPSLSTPLTSTTEILSTKASTTQAPTSSSPLLSTTQMSSTQKSTTATITTTTTTTTTQINTAPTSCFLCSGPPYICEHMYHQEQCPDGSYQYCINKMTNNRDGTRLLERRCATKSECETDWWQNTSDRAECTKYDINQAVSRVFKCSYCCSGPLCNEQLIPKDLYIGKH